jgi:putative flavoprotein involved in K+ transport
MQTQYNTIVIGGGQAGLAAGYFLASQDADFVILDANARTGDSWRLRWDSLRLFTPAVLSSLPGLRLPGPPSRLLGKDEMADYLERYADHFRLPVRHGTTIRRLSREGQYYVLEAGDRQWRARQVVVATGSFQAPKVPAFAAQLDPSIHQLHSSQYRNPAALPLGDVLVVGVGNSGGEIALELAHTRRVFLSGDPPGRIPNLPPFILGPVLWFFLHHATTQDGRFGRLVKARAGNKGTPLEGITEKDFLRAGVERLPATIGVQAGQPVMAGGHRLSIASVLWATGFKQDFTWIDLPIFDAQGQPRHYRGMVTEEPGLYFLGLPFQHAISSVLIGGVGRDAEYVAAQIKARAQARRETPAPEAGQSAELMPHG